MFRRTVINVLCIIGLLLLGYFLGVYFGGPSDFVEEPIDAEKVDSLVVKKELEKIDSLTKVIETYENLNSDLKDSIETVTIIRTVKVNEVNKLPLDSGVLFLKHKLGEFESKFN